MITHEFSGAVSSSSGLCSPVKALIATPTSVARLHRHRDCFCSRDVLRSVASAFYCARHLLDLVACVVSLTPHALRAIACCHLRASLVSPPRVNCSLSPCGWVCSFACSRLCSCLSWVAGSLPWLFLLLRPRLHCPVRGIGAATLRAPLTFCEALSPRASRLSSRTLPGRAVWPLHTSGIPWRHLHSAARLRLA